MGRELKVQMEGVLENQAMARAIAAAYAAEMDPTVDELTEIKRRYQKLSAMLQFMDTEAMTMRQSKNLYIWNFLR